MPAPSLTPLRLYDSSRSQDWLLARDLPPRSALLSCLTWVPWEGGENRRGEPHASRGITHPRAKPWPSSSRGGNVCLLLMKRNRCDNKQGPSPVQ